MSLVWSAHPKNSEGVVVVCVRSKTSHVGVCRDLSVESATHVAAHPRALELLCSELVVELDHRSAQAQWA